MGSPLRSRAVRIPTFAVGLVLAVALGACAGEEPPPDPVASGGLTPEQAKLPLFKQPPDKPAGPNVPLEAPQPATSFRLETVADGFEQPMQVLTRFADDRLYVVERTGRVVTAGRPRRTVLDLRGKVSLEDEQGLITGVFSPSGEHLTVMFTDLAGDTRVVRYPVAGTKADAAKGRTLLEVDQPFPNHNGGTLVHDTRGRLLLGLGDGGSAFDRLNKAQDPLSRLGKLLRYDGGRWTAVGLGLRNPFRMSVDRTTGRLWIGDVGQDRFEAVEVVDVPEDGAPPINFGWPAYEGPLPVGRKGLSEKGVLTWPVAGFTHDEGCSITGGLVARRTRVAALRDRYLYADFCRGTVWSIGADPADPGSPRRETAAFPGLVAFGLDVDGEVLVVSLLKGSVKRLVPAEDERLG